MEFRRPLVVAALAAVLGGQAHSQPAEPLYELPRAELDLRTMLRRHILRRSGELLEAAAQSRNRAIQEGSITAFRDTVRKHIREILGPVPKGAPLNVRAVSQHDRPNYRIENVLFESLPGWDVNATVYLPRAERFPPPWPAIVVPVGHSGKQFESYQIPAQVFALNGYVALTFDPPGQAGEKRPGNDHFRDGVRCYLTGSTSQRFFVIDALRAIDYLATRRDVDMRRGVGMTGVSGGGFTTLYAAPLDDRIRAAGPSCFAAPELEHPLRDGYPPCPETLPLGIYPRGIEAVNLLVAAHPTPMLVMAGKDDEVFKIEWLRGMAEEAAKGYAAGGSAGRFRFYMDNGGHAYTVAQALEFVRWMDRWVRGTPDRSLPEIGAKDVEMAPYDLLRSHPRPEDNMLTITRREADRLAAGYSATNIAAAAAAVARFEQASVPRATAAKPFLVWSNYFEELLLTVDRDIQLPATFLRDAGRGQPVGAILYFDDRGRWAELVSGGMLGAVARFTEPAGPKPSLLTVDLRGWGDTRPAPSPYDAAGWASPQRSLAYVSAALGDPVFAMRIRDGLSALAYLRTRIQPKQRILVGGRGMGGVVALHVAAIDRRLDGVFVSGIPASFRTLAGAASYSWDHDAFFPGVLQHYDLPELLAGLRIPALVVNPLDALEQPVPAETARALYRAALETGRLELEASLDQSRARQAQQRWVERQWR